MLRSIRQHLAKGDPRDVAAYCAFAWYHGWSLTGEADEDFETRAIVAEFVAKDEMLKAFVQGSRKHVGPQVEATLLEMVDRDFKRKAETARTSLATAGQLPRRGQSGS